VNAFGKVVADEVNGDGAECSVDDFVQHGTLFRCELFLGGHFILLEWQQAN
jgi:hypothetical protein